MSEKVSAELRRKVEAARAADEEIPVIVTLSEGADAAALSAQGLSLRRSFESIPAVAGTVSAARVDELAQLDQVKLIEFDGEMEAL